MEGQFVNILTTVLVVWGLIWVYRNRNNDRIKQYFDSLFHNDESDKIAECDAGIGEGFNSVVDSDIMESTGIDYRDGFIKALYETEAYETCIMHYVKDGKEGYVVCRTVFSINSIYNFRTYPDMKPLFKVDRSLDTYLSESCESWLLTHKIKSVLKPLSEFKGLNIA